MTETSTVYIVDDDELVRESLAALVSSVGLQAESFANADLFLTRSQQSLSGCVIADMRMPGMSGIELQEALVSRGVTIPVIVMSAYGDVSSAVRAMKAGAVDFVEKPYNNQELLDLIQASVQRDGEQRKDREEAAQLQLAMDRLTPRERQVMGLVVKGKSNKEIARTLDISLKTVESHRAKVMDKMAAQSLADLVRMTERALT